MRPEKKSTQNEISTRHKRNFVYTTFYCGENEMKIRFGGGPRKMTYSINHHSCFDEINTCADVFFAVISFRIVKNFFVKNLVKNSQLTDLCAKNQLMNSLTLFLHITLHKKSKQNLNI